jgi:thymidylate synthase (FAD)
MGREFMKATLLQYTPDPERTVAAAARLCYSPVGADEIREKMTDEQVESFLGKIIKLGHYSTLEHVSFTFAIEGVSRVLTHQLVRHRIASYSQQSQRYVQEHDFEFIMPPAVREIPEAKARFEQLMDEIRRTYDDLIAMGAHQEDARYVLANATETKIVVTMNGRALLHFFALRCCNRAQWEIRALAKVMLKQVKRVAPALFAAAGPECLVGSCPEGTMTCGQAAAVRRELFETQQ